MVTISSLAAAIVAEVEPPQRDAAFFKILDDLQRVRGRPEHAIHLGRDDDIARLDDREQSLALGPQPGRDTAGDTGIVGFEPQNIGNRGYSPGGGRSRRWVSLRLCGRGGLP